MIITKATVDDIPALVPLINSAYRGEASKKGWTTEAHLLKGALRTDTPSITELIQQPGAAFFTCVSSGGIISGCVFLQKQERGLYLGMLTVSPDLQAAGIGKQLLAFADQYAIELGCAAIFMSVISLRTELIAWYERHGYHITDERKPFPVDDRFGVPVQPLEFVIMEKIIV